MMIPPKNLSIKDFNYNLPEGHIAKYPFEKRDESKLLIYQNENIKEDIYFNLDKYIPSGSLLIFNDTKVVEARILFEKATGGIVELFCLEPDAQYPDITTALQQKAKVAWKCLAGGAKKWKTGWLKKSIMIDGRVIELVAEKKEKTGNYFLIWFSWSDDALSFAEILHHAGRVPLPPYLHRNAEEKDKETYQTVYALHDGSVAAPTAGLHFTERLFEKFKNKNINKDFVTLHVGAGTFMPVKTETMEQHEMHVEFIEVKKSFVENLLNRLPGNIIAVGTTSLRTIESLYWMGIKTMLHPLCSADELYLKQWEAYEFAYQNISSKESLQSLLNWMQLAGVENITAKTQMIIAPGYQLKLANALITNFHQPQSTLLLLVAAIAGENWKDIYTHAIENDFRFLSYGDGCLIWAGRD